MAPLLPLLVAGFLHVLTATKTGKQQLCVDAENECKDDFTCELSFIVFNHDCANVMRLIREIDVPNVQPPIPRNCSKVCVDSIKKLKSTKKGYALETCNCNLDGACLTMKARVNKCLNGNALNKPSCTMANVNCSGDSHCKKLKNNFLKACNHMINGVECEDMCLKAQNELAKNKHGKVLFNCECDGVTELFCRGIEANAKQLNCLPGMDGSGKSVFTVSTIEVIHGTPDDDYDRNSSSMPVFSYVLLWTLVFLLSYV